LVTLDRPGQRLVLAGINHVATGTASFANGERVCRCWRLAGWAAPVWLML